MRLGRVLLPLLLVSFLLPGTAQGETVDTTVGWCFIEVLCPEEVIPGRGGPGVRGFPLTLLLIRDGGIFGTTVRLTVETDCEDCVFRWDMGDGTVRSGRSVTHTYDIRWLWADFLVELQMCHDTEEVCETRFIPVRFFNGPAIVTISTALILLLWLLRRKIRYRVVRVR